MAEEGQRSLLACLLDRGFDVGVFLRKVNLATTSRELLQREKDGPIGILEKVVETKRCECSPTGLWLRLAEDTLVKNGVLEEFTSCVYRALVEGRGKKNCIFMMGLTNYAKSFRLKPLRKIFQAYSIPDDVSHKLVSRGGDCFSQ